ncbi:nf-x1 finger and helicase domain protein [Stemphylium lycopersici]|nr:nf-x1 finger and helicase domain protein [Stemphylium lycopersici]RAR07726.1 nf-x1 finger and helicase domain protein [Stemphylium lycopersici]
MSWRRGGRGQRGGGAGDRGNTQPTCYEFRTKGVCERPNCRFSHNIGLNDTSSPSAAYLSTDSASAQQRHRDQRTCHFYRNGNCNRGAHCRFSHNTSEEQPSHDELLPRRINESTEQKQARQTYNAWKSYLGKDPDDFRTMRRLWKGAQAILQEGDRDWKQQLPQDLATDDQNYKGYQHIGAILGRRVLNNDYDDFVKVCRDFLLTMTHPSIVDCLAVDTQVVSLFNYISGTNGSRAVPFFQHLCETLVALRIDDSPPVSVELLEGTLVAMSRLLSELLRRNARARFNNNLQTLTEALEAASKIFAPNGPNVPSTLVSNCVADVRAIVARAKGLLATPGLNNDPRLTAPVIYPRDFVLPSNRHDNDKIDIAEIVIFPTLDEIMSDAQECLPFTDPNQPHFLTNPVERHIDTYFRLLRHEIFGDLKEALSCLMQELTRNPALFDSPKIKLGDVRAHQYSGAFISGLKFTGKQGLEFDLSFQQPSSIQEKPAGKQLQWWTDMKRLGRGSLISFIWLQNATVQHAFLEVTEPSAEKREAHVLINPDNSATVTVRMMTQDKPALTMLMEARAGLLQGIILEFPKLMPATFVPILENLQGMQRLGHLPFSQWIVPSRHTEPSSTRVYHIIPPPLYARNPGFIFPLRSIVGKEDGKIMVQPTSSCDDRDMLDILEAKTPLDRGQCRALISALTREYAFIQGPPGTGKSYLGLQLMKVLLDVKAKAKLGPILVVCYTNHALDQFLEHLLDDGVEKIIRVGGQSKSDRLKECNLNKLKRGEMKTKSERRMIWEAHNTLGTHEEEGVSVLHQLEHLRKHGEWSDLATHICEDYPEIHSQFRDIDDEGFKHVGRHPFDLWKVGDAPSTIASHHPQPVASIRDVIQKATIDAYSLTFLERQALVAHFVKEIHDAKVAQLYEILNAVAAWQVSLENVYAEASRRILEGADVIGITTSGLAGKISLLKHVRCKVMVCEEAGEILEPHMISALLPSVQHCIQIGDHEQLRPSVSNYKDLSTESQRGRLHQLDKSQFERLCVGEHGRPVMPIAQLNVQRRMRPEISALIRETIYDKLIDHAITYTMPDVVGLRKNVFWLDHNHFEDGMDVNDQFDKSKTNTWEVAMVQALVHHVIRQGVYKSSEIAVLTPYTGQLQKLRQAMRNDFEIVLSDRDQEALKDEGYESDEPQLPGRGVDISNDEQKPLQKQTLINLLRVATVDNFQGEEAKVVIISLVRSNEKEEVGFLKSSNRINVLLSRAKHGMYIIGNTETYANVTMWKEVINILRTEQSVGQYLGLCCPRHPETTIDVQTPDDFEVFSPQGGCMEPCQDRLPCGHSCTLQAHEVPFEMSGAMRSMYSACGMKPDGEPDMILFQPYSDIDLDESPIVVLGCSHFFTIETLDGQIDIKQVYSHDAVTDQYTGLVENSQLAVGVPQCPHCRTPIRQHVTQRYNRIVNRAVMDEISKRFIVNGQKELRGFESRLQKLEKDLESSREGIVPNVTIPVGNPQLANLYTQGIAEAINDKLANRYLPTSVLEKNVKACQLRMADKNQPATKLHEAMVYAINMNSSINDALSKLSLDASAASAKRNRDQRVTFGFRSIKSKVRCLVLEDKYEVACAVQAKYPTTKPKLVFPGGEPLTESVFFLNQCAQLIRECTDESLPKFAVEATLYFSRITGLISSSGLYKDANPDTVMQYREVARWFLKKAAELCQQPFQGAKELAQAVEHSDRLLGKAFYQEVSREELEAIKQAMVSGSGGIATHSGHWYECERGHPFAIGECGMPMEYARCPECGAAIGGQNHTAVEGVTRSTRMED